MNDAAACLITLAQYRRQHRRRQWHLWLKRSGYAGYFFGVGVNGTLLKANGESDEHISTGLCADHLIAA
jgi:hypothetical protein